jgi:hypothetical protein
VFLFHYHELRYPVYCWGVTLFFAFVDSTIWLPSWWFNK